MSPIEPIPNTWSSNGLIDIQVNGYAGFDFNSPAEAWTREALQHVRLAMGRRGTLVALPTLITSNANDMVARARRYAELLDQDPSLATTFPKLHIEGPFISPDDGPRGAHPAQHCRTPQDEPDLLDRLWEASDGRIGILTLAPELPGAMNLIMEATERGICVAIGHTQASPRQIQDAVEAGARMSTHLGNGSHQMLPRLDNYMQAQLAEDRLAGCFIADGHHMPFTTLKNLLRAKTPENSILVTDAICAADMGPGQYSVAGMEVEVSPELRVAKRGEPNLAGSALTLDRAVINVAMHCGFSFEQTWAMASTNPARALGIEKPRQITVSIDSNGFQLKE